MSCSPLENLSHPSSKDLAVLSNGDALFEQTPNSSRSNPFMEIQKRQAWQNSPWCSGISCSSAVRFLRCSQRVRQRSMCFAFAPSHFPSLLIPCPCRSTNLTPDVHGVHVASTGSTSWAAGSCDLARSHTIDEIRPIRLRHARNARTRRVQIGLGHPSPIGG